jgi:AICAR transformylase/IMP cyclohydrolase PurH
MTLNLGLLTRLAVGAGIAWLGYCYVSRRSAACAAQMAKEEREQEMVDMASDMSFPASDPPPFTTSHS